MPVNFLTHAQRAQYGHYLAPPSEKQLAKFFHLDDQDRQFIKRLHHDHTRLGFAVQLGTARFLGTFLSDLSAVPEIVVAHMATELNVGIDGWSQYGTRVQRQHKKLICQKYGYEEFHQSSKPFTLMRQLYAQSWLTEARYLTVFDQATSWLVQNKVLLPGATVLERWVAHIVSRSEQRLWNRLVGLIDETQTKKLKNLLAVADGERFSELELLRRPASRSSSPVIKHVIERLEGIRAIGVNKI